MSSDTVHRRLCFAIILMVLSQGTPGRAQSSHPTGLRGGFLVPSGQTLSGGALAISTYGNVTTNGTDNVLLGSLGLAYGLTNHIQLSGVVSAYNTGSGSSMFDFSGGVTDYSIGPFNLTFGLPGRVDRKFHFAFTAGVTPGLAGTGLPGHNVTYGRDTFDINVGMMQDFRAGSFDIRLSEALVITEEAMVNLPNRGQIGLGITWWPTRTIGIESETLFQPELAAGNDITDDYIATGGGAVFRVAPWLYLRGGYLRSVALYRLDEMNGYGDWMIYSSIDFVFGGRDRPEQAEKPERQPRERRRRQQEPPPTPGDSDGDGVPDESDLEPDTPAGAVVDAEGRALDGDGDGVPDGIDQEPDTAEGARVDSEGKALDGDGDGIPDGIDREPDTPAGAVVDDIGRAVDSDDDGVPDGIDVEPNTPRGIPVNAEGRGLYGMEAELITRGLLTLNTIYFDFNTVTIKPESFQTLEEVGLILARYNELRIEIGGHTDNTGEETYNQVLSRVRAESVLNWLLENVPELSLSQFTVVGYGESQPYATNETEAGRTLNRRVEFKVLNTEELAKYRRIPPD
jgi:outer membrane protein OmpA-like peptidoglycan-associated protein